MVNQRMHPELAKLEALLETIKVKATAFDKLTRDLEQETKDTRRRSFFQGFLPNGFLFWLLGDNRAKQIVAVAQDIKRSMDEIERVAARTASVLQSDKSATQNDKKVAKEVYSKIKEAATLAEKQVAQIEQLRRARDRSSTISYFLGTGVAVLLNVALILLAGATLYQSPGGGGYQHGLKYGPDGEYLGKEF